jgi:Mycotoxin biosynthesis protein UstYa
LQNHVRRALNRDYYINDTHLLDEEHISHCVDAIRQSLMLVLLEDVFASWR